MQHVLKKVGFLGCVMLLVALCLPGGHALADSLKRAGLPVIDGITLIGVENGKLKYRTGAGDTEVALDAIESIGVDAAPKLAEGQKSLAEGQLRAAQRSLEDVWSKNRVKWVRHFAGFYLMQVYDRRGRAVDAATVFAQLASEKADVQFLSKAPTASLKDADDNQKERIAQQILAVAEDARGERRRLVKRYLKIVVGEDGPTLPDVVEENNPNAKDPQDKAGARKNAKVVLPQGLWAITDRTGEPKGKWDAVDLLSKGEYQKALDAVKPMMNARGDIAPKLFIYAKALLGLADQKNDQDLYLDAGLAFMRIVVHFNRPGQVHPLVAPARLEVAYVHQQIGREDIYKNIIQGVGGGGGIGLLLDDAKEYPYYRARYYQVIGEKIPADKPEEGQP